MGLAEAPFGVWKGQNAVKAEVANNRLTTPLFDTERFTRDLERAFEAMCERHRLGLPPEDIDLAP